MPKLVEALRERKFTVHLRSSYDITTKLAVINVTDKPLDTHAALVAAVGRASINIGIIAEDLDQYLREEKERKKRKDSHSTEEPKAIRNVGIPIDEITLAKARDYGDEDKYSYGIMVVRKTPTTDKEPTCSEQVLFLFGTLEERDTWQDGLHSMLSDIQHYSTAEPRKDMKLRLIRDIEELLPERDDLVRFAVTVGDESDGGTKTPSRLIFRVPKAAYEKEQAERRRLSGDTKDKTQKYHSELCKELVEDFVLHNFVIPAESVSLYRYVRSILNRLSMEAETIAITNEMDKLRLNESATQRMHPSEMKRKVKEREEKLTKLRKSLSERIGSHGPGASLIIKVLERSIDKTTYYNQYLRHAILGTSGADEDMDDEGVDD